MESCEKIICVNDVPCIVLENHPYFKYKVLYKGEIRILYLIDNKLVCFEDNEITPNSYVYQRTKFQLIMEWLNESIERLKQARVKFDESMERIKKTIDKIK